LCAPTGATLAQSASSAELRTQASVALLERAGTAGDFDGDSIDDVVDLDDDNDTIPDNVEGLDDADNDGIPNCLDLDSDNDGITDLIEAAAGSGRLFLLDANRDGFLDDTVEVGQNGLADIVEDAADSSVSVFADIDADGDGIQNQLDLDADNDGIPDILEAGSSDNDRNGVYDFFLDLDGDGLADRLASLGIWPRDSDDDGVADFLDIDSDNDGLTDRLETAGDDTDSDGRVDTFSDLNGDGLDDAYMNSFVGLVDSDRDGFPDYRDIDSDGDGVTDSEEANASPVVTAPIVPVSPFNPTAPSEPVTLITGESGNVFGCAIAEAATSTRHRRDPIFLILCIAAFVLLAYRRKPLAVLCTALLSTGCIAPQSAVDGNRPAIVPYVGLGLGTSFLNANTSEIPLEQDQSYSPAGQITLGLGVGRAFAVEARAADLGELTFTNGAAVGYQVVDVSGLARYNRNALTTFARFGAGALRNDGDINTEQEHETHLLVGVGVDYQLGHRFGLRAEWQGHDEDVMHAQLSVLYRFGTPAGSQPPIVLAENRSTNSGTDFQAIPEKARESTVEDAVDDKPEASQGKKIDALVDRLQIEQVPAEPIAVEPAPIESPPPQVAAAPDTASNPAPVLDTPPKPVIAAPDPDSIAEPAVPANTTVIATAPAIAEIDVIEKTVPEEVPSDQVAVLETPSGAAGRPTDNASESVAKSPGNASISQQTVTADVPQSATGTVDASEACRGLTADDPDSVSACPLFGESVSGLTFEPNSDQLTDNGQSVLDSVAGVLDASPELRVTVTAHTDTAADPQAALFLTRRRTIAIIRYLSDSGIDAARLRPQAFGDTQPLEGTANDRVSMSVQ